MAAIRLALVDDHAIVRSGIKTLLEKSDEFTVIFESPTPDELLSFLSVTEILPDLVLLDIKMPGMSPVQAMRFLKTNFPQIRVVIFSMLTHTDILTELFSNGAVGYVSKSSDTEFLGNALLSVMQDIRVFERPGENLSIKALNSHIRTRPSLSEQDIRFLKFCATELTYNEIAAQLNVSPRTVNGYREKLFELLGIQSRTGLAMYAVRNGIAE
jgi:DNA-binding NarL/FixJ family response regulator